VLTKENIINYISLNKERLNRDFKITKIGLFGSFATGKQKKTSDIDLIVEFQKDTDSIFDIKIKLSEILKTQFNREVDIAREKYLKPRVKEEILKEVIYIE
jgi:hypothetical protein